MSESDPRLTCCSAAPKLIFACSGAADLGHISDLAARKLTAEGAGKMLCLAGIEYFRRNVQEFLVPAACSVGFA